MPDETRTPPSRDPAVKSAELDYFKQIPWCAGLLSRPGTKVWHPFSRRLNPPLGDGTFFKTLNTPDAIPAFLMFYNPPTATGAGSASPTASTSPPTPLSSLAATELSALVALGDGVTGHPGIAHGGFLTAILDEVLGNVATANREAGVIRGAYMTVSLNTTYLAPVRTPGAVLVTSHIVRQDGRKLLLAGTIKDGDGKVLAKGEGLFLRVGKSQL